MRAAADRLSVFLIGLQWNLRRLWRHVKRPGALVVGLAIALSGIAQILKQQDLPNDDAWKGVTVWSGVYVAAASVAFIGGVLVTRAYWTLVRKSSADSELADLCKSIWVIVQRHTTIPFDRVGVHVWAVRGMWGARYLERRATFIPEARKSTPITWRRGKGAIGLCWDQDTTLVADVERLEQDAPTENDFNALPHEDRFGFSWHELRESRHYRAILAVPLRQARWGRFRARGCLSVDLRIDGKVNELDTLVARDDFGAIISVCEAVLYTGRP